MTEKTNTNDFIRAVGGNQQPATICLFPKKEIGPSSWLKCGCVMPTVVSCSCVVLALLLICVSFESVSASSLNSNCINTNAKLNKYYYHKSDNATSDPQETKGMQACSWYRKSTCCSQSGTTLLAHQLMPFIPQVEGGDLTSSCSEMYNLYNCRVCSPDWGRGWSGNQDWGYTCQNFYESFYQACRRDKYTKWTYIKEDDATLVTKYYPDNKNGFLLDNYASNAEEFYENILYYGESADYGKQLAWDQLSTSSDCWNAGNRAMVSLVMAAVAIFLGLVAM